jgi:hypothetical protein
VWVKRYSPLEMYSIEGKCTHMSTPVPDTLEQQKCTLCTVKAFLVNVLQAGLKLPTEMMK